MSQHPFSIHLRAAELLDIPLLRHWDEQPHTIAASPNEEWDWEEELPKKPEWRALLIAELDDRPIGFLHIIDPLLEETHYWGAVPPHYRALDIWIGEAEDLGKGYGTVMMRLALERCFNVPEVTTVLIDPLTTNTKARRFYERMGFHYVEDRTFDKDECAVYQLKREDWEVKPF
jgi:aminoglycoside 6'-N-acetyltransferase